ncbi:MAG: hypothetical protein U0842_19780 [Candidatus Binatia bacterium]|jgi:hypothetical protein
MPDPDLLTLFVRPLEELGIRYMVSGSVASTLFGEPRMTHDVDLVAFLDEDAIAALGPVFAPPEFYLPPHEVMLLEARRESRGHFNVIHVPSGLKADVYPANRDPLHAWAITRALRVPVGTLTVSVAPPEYVILRKLEYHREGGSEKHLRDIRAMLALSLVPIDRAALADWLARLGLEAQWRLVTNTST